MGIFIQIFDRRKCFECFFFNKEMDNLWTILDYINFSLFYKRPLYKDKGTNLNSKAKMLGISFYLTIGYGFTVTKKII